jgi:hypothetical protein
MVSGKIMRKLAAGFDHDRQARLPEGTAPAETEGHGQAPKYEQIKSIRRPSLSTARNRYFHLPPTMT